MIFYATTYRGLVKAREYSMVYHCRVCNINPIAYKYMARSILFDNVSSYIGSRFAVGMIR